MQPNEFLALFSSLYPLQVQDFLRLGGSGENLSSPGLAMDWLRSRMSGDGEVSQRIEAAQCERVYRLHEDLLTKSIFYIYPGHQDYPKNFFQAEPLPLIIYYRGQLPATKQKRLAVVGSREIQAELGDWLEIELGQYLSRQRSVVISGGARGVDQIGHRVALRHNVPTVVFLPSGLENIYPRDFASWVSYIMESGGCLMSEFPPDVPMRRYHFAKRNRLIAAFADLVLIAQAARASGTMMTAKHALQMGRSLCVVPQAPFLPEALGGIDLIADGAMVVRDWRDLLLAMDTSGPNCFESPNCVE